MAFSTFKCFATITTIKLQNIFITPKRDPTIKQLLPISLSPVPDNHWLSFCETSVFAFSCTFSSANIPSKLEQNSV